MIAIDKVIRIATAEIGYLEKKSGNDLYEKTANVGINNYTKYWEDIKPDYQGQPWCACFITWCFVKAFGQKMAKTLLKHYPYVYCPTMSGLFNLHANPKRGDIVIFYRNGIFAHTGIVTSVSGDYFTTIEGNTSAGSSIIANGGGVCSKGYYNSKLPGTKFCRPNYEIIKEDELMSKEYENLDTRLKEIEKQMLYDYVDENMPSWARPTIQKMLDKGILRGDEHGKLGLTDELLRIFVTNDRAGLYDLK